MEGKESLLILNHGDGEFKINKPDILDEEEGGSKFLIGLVANFSGLNTFTISDSVGDIAPMVNYANGDRDPSYFTNPNEVNLYDQLMVANYFLYPSYFSFLMRFVNLNPDMEFIIHTSQILSEEIISELSLVNVPFNYLTIRFLNLWQFLYNQNKERLQKLQREPTFTDGSHYVINEGFISTFIGNMKNGPTVRWNDRTIIYYTNFIDDKQNGIELAYFNNGQLRIKKFYLLGKENGPEVDYFDNGQLRISKSYIDGKENGVEENYYKDGSLRLERVFENGKVVRFTNYPAKQ